VYGCRGKKIIRLTGQVKVSLSSYLSALLQALWRSLLSLYPAGRVIFCRELRSVKHSGETLSSILWVCHAAVNSAVLPSKCLRNALPSKRERALWVRTFLSPFLLKIVFPWSAFEILAEAKIRRFFDKNRGRGLRPFFYPSLAIS
jgi:hypothetical protein